MIKEIWRDIEGYKGIYQISNKGNVKSLNRIAKNGKKVKEKILKQSQDKDGYILFTLCRNGRQKTLKAHRLVAKTFISNINNKPCVNHLNGIKNDNIVSNLEWVTVSENTQHSYDNKLQGKGSKHGRSTLTVEDVKNIRGEIGKTQKELALKFNSYQSVIGRILRNETYTDSKYYL